MPMMIFTTSILALPLMLIVWALDAYLFVASLRLVVGRLAGMQQTQFFACMRQLTDGLPQTVTRWLVAYRGRSVPPWLPWVVVIGAAVTLRFLLLGIILAAASA